MDRPIAAQQYSNSGTNADSYNPLGPNGPNKPSDIWNLDPNTGSVHIQIPIATVPEGGRGPKIQPLFQYNSAATWVVEAPIFFTDSYDSSGNPLGVNSYSWGTPVGIQPMGGSPGGPWTFTYGPSIFGLTTTTYDQAPPSPSGFGTPGICNNVTPLLLASSDGQIHDLGLSVTYKISDPGQSAACVGTAVNTHSQTADGSNIVSTISDFVPQYTDGTGTHQPFSPGSLSSVLLPDGSQIRPITGNLAAFPYSSSAALEDANGNIFTAGGVDSEGRMIASSSPSLKMGTSDLSGGAYTLTTQDYSGSAQSYTIAVASQSFSGGFTMPHPTVQEVVPANSPIGPGALVIGPQASSIAAVTSIQLPNGSTYQFTYDPTYGTISSITFPTGGHVRFVWGVRGVGASSIPIRMESTIVATDVYVSESSDTTNEAHWHYQYYDLQFPNNIYTPGSMVSETTAPDGTVTAYTSNGFTYNAGSSGTANYTFQETMRQISDAAGTPLLSVATSYEQQYSVKPNQVTTTYFQSNGAIQNTVVFAYDGFWNEVERDESSFYACQSPCSPPASPPGGWLRKTMSNYLWSNPNPSQPIFQPSYSQANIVNKPSQVSITDGAGSLVAQTQYNYDESPLSGSAGILNHDDTNYPAARIGARGNLTTERHCVLFASNACASWISKRTTYDLTGMPVSTTDFNGNATTYSYADAYVAGGPSSQTNAYPTAVTTGSSPYVANYTYNYFTGSAASYQDWNGNTTAYAYADTLNRITAITFSSATDGTVGGMGNGGTSYVYNDMPGSLSVTKSVVQNLLPQSMSSISSLDGLGRVIQSQKVSGLRSLVTQDTTYDSMGRVYSVSTPYFLKTDASYGLQTTVYDALGRVRRSQNPDGSSKLWFYDGLGASCPASVACSTHLTSTNGTWIDSLDELGNHTQRTSDAQGRLVNVMEASPGGGASALETDYSYDASGNLLAVNQAGASGDTPRLRSFTYDGVSRLLCASNPENGVSRCPATATAAMPLSGVTLYSYDSNGNLGSKTSPLVNASSGIQTISYRYDTLNRLLSKTYGGKYPSSCYQYDQAVGGLPGGNLLGRLTNSWTQTGSTCPPAPPLTGLLSRHSFLSYDAMGRLLSEQQCTRASCGATIYSPSYSYDLAGERTSTSSGISSGSGSLVFHYSYDPVGNLSTVGSNSTMFSGNLFAATQGQSTPMGCNVSPSLPAYTAAGSLQNAIFGQGLQLTRSYDNRLRVNCETDFGNSAPNPTPGIAKITISGTDQTH